MKNGAEQAVADLNRRGGVLGKKLALENRRRCLRPQAGALGSRKVRRRKVPFVTGHYLLSSIPASEAYATATCCRLRRPRPIRCHSAAMERGAGLRPRRSAGLVAAQYIAKFYKGKERRHPQTTRPLTAKASRTETKKSLNKPAFTEKMFESYNKGDKEFNAIVSRLKRDNIDLVYVGGYHQESGCWCARCAIRVLRRS